MTQTLTFHVPPDAHPEVLQTILRVVTGRPASHAEFKERVADVLGHPPRTEAIALARDLRLIAETPGGVMLTPLGEVVAVSSEQGDLIHGLSYFAWEAVQPNRLSRLWTYRTVIDLLWDMAPVVLNAPLKKRIVEDVLARLELEFSAVPGFDLARTSVGPKSVDGVLRWLERLHPSVIRDRDLLRRQRCPPPLMVLALTAAARDAHASLGSDFRLSAEDRARAYHACFLEPTALDAMLDWTVQTQPKYLRWGTRNARYGRQIMLHCSWPA